MSYTKKQPRKSPRRTVEYLAFHYIILLQQVEPPSQRYFEARYMLKAHLEICNVMGQAWYDLRDRILKALQTSNAKLKLDHRDDVNNSKKTGDQNASIS